MSTTTTTRPSPSSPWAAPTYFSTTPLGFPAADGSSPSAGQQSKSGLLQHVPESPRVTKPTSPGYFNVIPTAQILSPGHHVNPGPLDRSPWHGSNGRSPQSVATAPLRGGTGAWDNFSRPQEDGTTTVTVHPYGTPQIERSFGSLTSPRLVVTASRPPRPVNDSRDSGGLAASKTNLLRTETAPAALDQGNVKMISGEECVQLLMEFPDQTLLLDVRPSPQYSEARIKRSLNLCIPTTLLKRPSFDLHKVESTLGSEQQKKRLREWQKCTRIIAYDSTTSSLKDTSTLISVLKKFTAEGWKGEPLILQGGFSLFSTKFPDWVEKGQTLAPGSRSHDKSLSISLKLPMPPHNASASAHSHNPLCRTMRQDIDLIDGVGQIPIKLPATMDESARKLLPQWLSAASDRQDGGKTVAEKFLAIEMAEQRRMQEALADSSVYSAPPSNDPDKQIFRIAGIEKGLKNRYSNIYPYDHSRVKLQGTPKDCCDYINASHAQASRSNKRYIATQAPLPETFNDFWRVVWEQDVRVIVMLTAETEGAQLKCHPYWVSGDYGPIHMKVITESTVPLQTHAAAPGQTSGQIGTDAPFITVRHITLSHANFPFQPLREVTQLQYSHWPDFGAPAEPSHLLRLVAECDRFSNASNTRPLRADSHMGLDPTAPVPENTRNVLVHCSAGCGRTGTFCTVDSVIDMLKRQRWVRANPQLASTMAAMPGKGGGEWVMRDDIDLIASTVEDFRTQRPSMVQSLRQFVLCYESVLEWIARQQQQQQQQQQQR
ncbi:hypothetical protein VTO42DRAFT_8600 [Malbranchea cinnamomea]